MRTKKVTALALVVALVVCLAGCAGGVYGTVVTIDGHEISSGLYLFVQWQAYTEASQKVEHPNLNILKQKITETIDDVETVTDADDWIRSRTLEMLLSYVATKKITTERGITLTEARQKSANSEVESVWSYYKTLLEKNGVSKETVRDYIYTEYLFNLLYEKLYLNGGEKEPSQEELAAQYREEYAHVRYNGNIFITTDEATGEDLETAEAGREALQELVDRLNAGELTFNDAMRYDIPKINAILDPDRYGDPEEVEEIPAEFDDDGEEIPPADLSAMFITYSPDNYDIYSEEFLAKLKGYEVGTFDFYEVQGMILLFEVIPIFEDEEDYKNNHESITREIMMDDYEDYMEALYLLYPVNWVFGARTYYGLNRVVTA